MQRNARHLSLPGLVIAACLSAGAATADDTQACFGRTYDDAHLAAHPGQQVRDIRVRQSAAPHGQWSQYELRVRFRDDPRSFRVQPGCSQSAGGIQCIVECDGGVMWPVHTSDGGLRLSTGYLRAETGAHLPGEGGCTDPVTRSMADQSADGSDRQTVFVLSPRDRRECAWNGPGPAR